MADRLAQAGVEAEVIDLRSIRPLDIDTVVESVRKTSRCVVAEEGWGTFRVGAEVAARVAAAHPARTLRSGRAAAHSHQCGGAGLGA